MQMRPDIQIQSVIKALTDVVLPAIDSGNKLAQEQVRLVIGLLGVMGQQIPLQFRFDCDELRRLLEFAAALQGEGAEKSELAALVGHGRDVLDRAKADPSEVVEVVRGLRAATGAAITEAYRSKDEARVASVERLTLAMASEQVLRERSWFRAQAWEPADHVPAIETLLNR